MELQLNQLYLQKNLKLQVLGEESSFMVMLLCKSCWWNYTTSISEDGTNIVYGGTNAAHNGGSLKYVRVEYAGKKIVDGNKENNGFSFYSVGSGTILENLFLTKVLMMDMNFTEEQ